MTDLSFEFPAHNEDLLLQEYSIVFSEPQQVQPVQLPTQSPEEQADREAIAQIGRNKGRPYGQGLFLTFPHHIVSMEAAKALWILLADEIARLQPKCYEPQGGVCIEQHNTSDGYHMHFVIKMKGERFQLSKRLAKYIDTTIGKHGNYLILNNFIGAIKYIQKGGNFWLNFNNELVEINRKEHRKTHNAEVIQKLVNNDYEPYTDGSIAPQNLKATMQGIQMLKTLQKPSWDVREKEVWFIYGKTRQGKSTMARETIANGNYYIKGINKWFDGYEGQNTIIIEDLPAYSDWLVYFLKMWLDTVHQTGEIKGGSVWLNARQWIITSNHPLEKCIAKKNFDGTTSYDNDDEDAIRKRIHHYWLSNNNEYMKEGSPSYHQFTYEEK